MVKTAPSWNDGKLGQRVVCEPSLPEANQLRFDGRPFPLEHVSPQLPQANMTVLVIELSTPNTSEIQKLYIKCVLGPILVGD